MTFKTKALKYLEEGNYDEYYNNIKKQHEIDNSEESAADLEKAEKKITLLKEIREFMKKEKACYYEVLGIDSKANQKQIREAYTKLMNKFHPDRTKIKESNAVSRIIQKAYSVLSIPEKRKEYDLKKGSIFHSSGSNYRFTVSNNFGENIFDYSRFRPAEDFASFSEDFDELFISNSRFFDAHFGSQIYNNLLRNLHRRPTYRRPTRIHIEEKFYVKLMLFIILLIAFFIYT